jgi:ATP-dependent Lhr-like helicase
MDQRAVWAPAQDWFQQQGWEVFPFQRAAWDAVATGGSGLVNAPTGSGKTYSLLLPFLLAQLKPKGTVLIWITPIRALAKEIAQSAERAIAALGVDWRVDVRTGDTDVATRKQQRAKPAPLLITTPESLHLLLAGKEKSAYFQHLSGVVVDEWHELLGSKRGVQVELALAHLRHLRPGLQVWGISATIGNLDEAMEVLMGVQPLPSPPHLIRSSQRKSIRVVSIMPTDVEELPWAGHLGIKMLERVVPFIHQSGSTVLFTNTRSQAEIWYQRLLEVAPELAGVLAMHHSSISKELRSWVEDALYEGRLKAVVSTSSLDLGVDFRPVDAIVQIGSPRGVSRFVQRAGRSGHQPGAESVLYFVPTHSLELAEVAALRLALERDWMERRQPFVRSFDVLIQFLVTLAVGEGFVPFRALTEVRSTHAFASISDEEWQFCLQFISTGGPALEGYDEFHKVVPGEDGLWKVHSRKLAMRHRLSIGTIVSDSLMTIRMAGGGYLGHVEEYFISKLRPGDVFWFAGYNLELVRVEGLVVRVRKTNQQAGLVPSWLGGRMPLSAELGTLLRETLANGLKPQQSGPEMQVLQPLLRRQKQVSKLPGAGEFLIESYHSKEGYHLFFYPFEGRLVHEGLAALLNYRLGLFAPRSFSIAMNDYGFELLSDQPIPIQEALDSDVFTVRDLRKDLMQSVNATEMARKRFRDIAAISGLVFQGYPGQPVKERHLQGSSSLIFNVLMDFEADHLLVRQAFEEALEFQLEEDRMRRALERISGQSMLLVELEEPSPLCFPIMVDRLREKMSTEKLEDQIQRMQRARK